MTTEVIMSEPSETAPRNRPTLSPLRVICLFNSHARYEDPGVQQTPWTRQDGLASTEVNDTNERGFITGHRLQKRELMVTNGLYNEAFPKCWVVERSPDAKLLCPQYGELTRKICGPRQRRAQETLQKWRYELNREMEKKKKGEWNWIHEPERRRQKRVSDNEAEPNEAMAEKIRRELEVQEAERKAKRNERMRQRREALDNVWKLDMNGVQQSER